LDECALHVHATVISRPPRPGGDVPAQSLSSDGIDPSFGRIRADLGYQDAVIERLNEEHGVVDFALRQQAGGGRAGADRSQPCLWVSNLHDEVAVSRGGELVDMIRVAARGKTR
jgi:D-serine deaminase-like pyridoxal phosphate-dependent protein